MKWLDRVARFVGPKKTGARLILGLLFVSSEWASQDQIRPDWIAEWAAGFFPLFLVVTALFQEYFIGRYRDYKENEARVEIARLKATINDIVLESLNYNLNRLLKSLGYDTAGHRVSLFRLIPKEDAFECVARYSKRPEIGRIDPKKRYPTNIGFIGAAWKNPDAKGFRADIKMPDPIKSLKKYVWYLKKVYQIKVAVGRKLEMKPRKISGQILWDTKNIPVALLVFEAKTKNDRFILRSLKNAKDSASVKRIVELLSRTKLEYE